MKRRRSCFLRSAYSTCRIRSHLQPPQQHPGGRAVGWVLCGRLISHIVQQLGVASLGAPVVRAWRRVEGAAIALRTIHGDKVNSHGDKVNTRPTLKVPCSY